jgi:DNA polymerase-3 subunit delta'
VLDKFYGNAEAVETLLEMREASRIPQTILLAGPQGVGKATLVRRFAGLVLWANEAASAQIENDDLSLAHNRELIAEREKLPSEKRAEDPLLLCSYPDFVTFAPEGPLRQISIQQIRLLKDQARLLPSQGERRVFLIDQIDRANEQAANSLLKVLEEPPPHLLIFMTAENPYDLLPTIRSRSVTVPMHRLDETSLLKFLEERGADYPQRRARLGAGSPGLAVTWDLEAYDKRRNAMLALLEVASRRAPFGSWIKHVESIAASKSEKLEAYLDVLYLLLEDLLLVAHGVGEPRNADIAPQLKAIADGVSFAWLRHAVHLADEMSRMLRRSIQKGIALDAFALELREKALG